MSDPTFGGTRPLRRVEALSNNRRKTSNNAEVQENGVPVSGHTYLQNAVERAKEAAKSNGLDHYFVNGEKRSV